jgi:hypothetical protein
MQPLSWPASNDLVTLQGAFQYNHQVLIQGREGSAGRDAPALRQGPSRSGQDGLPLHGEEIFVTSFSRSCHGIAMRMRLVCGKDSAHKEAAATSAEKFDGQAWECLAVGI